MMTEQERAEQLALLDAELVVFGEDVKILTEEVRKTIRRWRGRGQPSSEGSRRASIVGSGYAIKSRRSSCSIRRSWHKVSQVDVVQSSGTLSTADHL